MLVEMTDEKARQLLAESRRLHWAFPSSQGTPIIKGDSASQLVEKAAQERESYANAARVLFEQGDEDAAVELAANVWRLWMVARDLTGGREFLAAVLDKGGKKPLRPLSLVSYGDSLFAHLQGKVEESRQRSQAALDAAIMVNDREALALAYLGLARVAVEKGSNAEAVRLALKARESARGLDPALGQAPLFLHASATRLLGDYDKAAELFEQSLALNRRVNDQGMVAAELQNLGFVELHRGNLEHAKRCFEEYEKLGFSKDPYFAGMDLIAQAYLVFSESGERDRSLILFQRAQDIFKEAKVSPGPDDQFEINWIHDQLKDKVRDQSSSGT
jgi:tetratricopeptide (TPR) repeat protein